ncbi:MAG: hypothetical protein MUC29_06630, partial [Pyrinomonadaceae bacterium]|nr:hypothetical protein [Pyrinomonadaceae bacterium]
MVNYTSAQTTETQKDKKKKKQPEATVRPVTIPISIFSKEELKEKQTDETIEAGDIFVKENKDDQVILSIRSVKDNPLYLAILIQNDLISEVNSELKRLSEFIKKLPKGSRVMVGFIRNGNLQTKQKFTEDLEKAANTMQVVTTSIGFSGNSPYDAVSETIGKFDSLPTGRRAILLISDGLDATRGFNSSTPSDSLELDKAILRAQKRSVAIYSIYAPATLTEKAEARVVLNAQGSLDKLSDETGGKSYIRLVNAPVNFETYFREISMALNRQFA